MNYTVFFAILLTSLTINPLSAQEPPKLRYTDAAAWTVKPAIALSDRGVFV